jgi:LPPG:FO 2-phospho-L-lactate transferase
MSDQAVRTRVSTERGDLPFQRYFVEHRCVPAVRAIAFDGAAEAAPAPALRQAFERPDLEAILICPSNPYLSIDPILAVPGVRAALASRRVPSHAVSPLVGGRAVKGPTAKLMAELGITPGSAAIAAHYAGLIDALILDTGDAGDVAAVAAHGLEAPVTATLMHDLEDRVRLAEACLALAARAPGPNR